MTSPTFDPANPFGAPFIDVFGMLRRRLAWVVISIAGGLWVGVLLLLVVPPPYYSRTEVLVIQKDANLPAKGVDKGGEFDKDVYEGLLSTHLQLIRSPRAVKRAIQEHRLYLLPTLEKSRDEEDPDGSEYIIDNLEITIGDDDPASEAGHVLHVEFQHSSGEEGAIILQAVLDSYRKLLDETYRDLDSGAIALIRQAQTELAQGLKAQEDAYLAFLEKSPLLWRGDGSKDDNIHKQRILKIEASLSDVRLKYAETRARLDIIEAAMRNVAPDSDDLSRLALLNDREVDRLTVLLAATRQDSDNESFQSLQPKRTESMRARFEQYLALMTRQKAQSLTLGPDHPKVRETRESLELVREFLEKNTADPSGVVSQQIKPAEMIRLYFGMLRHDLAELEKSRTTYEGLLAEESAAAKAMLGFELRGEAMRQEVDRKRALFEAVVDRLHGIDLIREFTGHKTEVIAAVEVGKIPSLWIPALLGIGCVLGTFTGFGLAWTAERRDRAIHGLNDVRKFAPGLSILARIREENPGAFRAAIGGTARLGLGGPDPGGEAATRRRTEAVRALRSALCSEGWGAGPLKVVQVTSPDLWSDKSRLVAELSAVTARTGRRVLVIDADAERAPRSPDSPPGLWDVLAGRVTPEAAIRPTAVEGLWFLGGGPPPGGSADLLAASRFAETLQSLRCQFDAILIDSPPMLSAADALELARHVDGVLLTVRIARTEGPALGDAFELLGGVGARVLGIVVDGCGERE